MEAMTMDERTAEILNALTRDFYARQAASFSATRQGPWPGWVKLWEVTRDTANPSPCRVLDLGCGNLRFESWLAAHASEQSFNFHGVDATADLVAQADPSIDCHFQEYDLMSALAQGNDLALELQGAPADLVVAFGFLHHIPGAASRTRFIQQLAALTNPGGIFALTSWNFMANEQMAEQTRDEHERALAFLQEQAPDFDLCKLEPGDYFKGWQDQADALRYCHYCDAAELGKLIKVAEGEGQAKLLARFESDGRTNDLNSYLIFQSLA